MKLKMISASFFFVICAVCFSSAAFAQVTKLPIERSASFMGGSYAYKLTEQDFANTPSWNQDGEPPITVSQAVKVARENLPRFVKNAESWKMRLITLQSMNEDKWYYRVLFFCFGATCREIEERSFTAIVKMDGNLVEPKKVTIEK